MNIENRLEDKVAIVTGAASGIGEAVSKIFTANACKVALIDINEKRLKQVKADIYNTNGICLTFSSNVTSETGGESESRPALLTKISK